MNDTPSTHRAMPKRSKLIVFTLLVLLLVIAVALITQTNKSPQSNKSSQTSTNDQQPAAQSDQNEAPQKIASVTITKDGFVPSTISVEAGTVVTWSNQTGSLRQIESNPSSDGKEDVKYKSELLNEGQSFSRTYENEGTFTYRDTQNPLKNGTIEVTSQQAANDSSNAEEPAQQTASDDKNKNALYALAAAIIISVLAYIIIRRRKNPRPEKPNDSN